MELDISEPGSPIPRSIRASHSLPGIAECGFHSFFENEEEFRAELKDEDFEYHVQLDSSDTVNRREKMRKRMVLRPQASFSEVDTGSTRGEEIGDRGGSTTLRRHISFSSAMPSNLQRKLSLVQEEKAMAAAPQGPIEVSRFLQHVQDRKKKRILFKGEFLMIKKSGEAHRSEVAHMKENIDKNQYSDILPFDYNRVVLKLVPGDAHSDYINASYIDGFFGSKTYLVTQAVKTKQACIDLWRMVWELRSNCIVMLTKVFDFMRVMCLQYWPLTRYVFGEIEVETLETKTYAHFIIRRLKLTKGEDEEPRFVQHFHFIEWELDSFPYISAFLELRRRVRNFVKQNPCEGPTIVHCSNGGGRSGAFICTDQNMELLDREGTIDIFGYSKMLMNSRHSLIESLDQYIFIYDVLAEVIRCSKIQPKPMEYLQNRISMMRFKKTRQTVEGQDADEYKMLCHLTPGLRIGDCAGGHRLENRGKNRDVMVVPPDHSRPYLQTLHGESKDYTYINAVYVDGFTRKSEWIVTEWPKHHTIDSLWALVFDHNCHTVVNMSNQGNVKTYPSFIHNKGRQVYGPFVVEVLNYHSYPSMTSHMVKVMKRTFMISEIMASGGNAIQEAETRICCIINVKMWPIEHKVPLSTSGLIDVIKMARSWRNRAPDRPETKPTIVLSHNGVSRCGIYIGANVCIDQMNMDAEVDIFRAVKMIRIHRPQLIDTKDEFKYLYDVMIHWYTMNPEYWKSETPADSVQDGSVVAAADNHVGENHVDT